MFVARRYVRLLQYLAEDSGSGVFIDQFAVPACKLQTFNLSKF